MSIPVLVGILLFLAVIVFAVSIQRRSAGSPAGTQTIVILVVVLAVVGVLVYMLIGGA